MSQTVDQRVAAIVAEQFNRKPEAITPGMRMSELGADNLDLLEIGIGIEDAFEISLDDDMLSQATTVGDWIALVHDRLAARAV